MILKSLTLKNFRSIKDLEEFKFPQSTMLFYVDIGSGKSSVLKAIEFALFGTLKAGALKGESLLRRGENSAVAELTFEINGKEYTVHRELKSKVRVGKVTITQPPGWLLEDGEKTEYTTTELRRKILAILNYSVSRYEKKGMIDIFRYTVYTPQEEIKKILDAEPEERFEILKDVLEIEKYETTLKNLNIIKTNLNRLIRDKEQDIKRLGTPEEKIPEKEEEITVKKTEIESIKEEISNKQVEKEKQDTKLEAIRTKLSNYSVKIKDIEAKEKQIQKDTKSIEENQTQLAKIKDEITKSKEELEQIPTIKLLTEKSEDELNQTLKELRDNHKEQNVKRGLINGKITDRESLLEKGVCPLCEQKIHEKDRFDRELKEARKKVQDLTESLNGLEKRIEKIEELKENRSKFTVNEEKLSGIKNLIEAQQKQAEVLKKSQEELQKNVKENKEHIQNILQTYEIEDLGEFKKLGGEIKGKLDHQKEKVEEIGQQIMDLGRKLGSFEAELNNLKEDLEKLYKDLERKTHLEKSVDYISNVRDWVTDKFPVLLKDIERMVLTATAVHFNRYFKEWFQVMVEEENIDVQVNPENFDPLIMVNGYESPTGDLSGGEQSALSLAYRLALNKVITTKHQEVKTKDLLILDEPTDGFSQQQINKMQDIFERLDTPQMIIISHERTLDSFVTDIFNFQKMNHVTKVTREE